MNDVVNVILKTVIENTCIKLLLFVYSLIYTHCHT